MFYKISFAFSKQKCTAPYAEMHLLVSYMVNPYLMLFNGNCFKSKEEEFATVMKEFRKNITISMDKYGRTGGAQAGRIFKN